MEKMGISTFLNVSRFIKKLDLQFVSDKRRGIRTGFEGNYVAL